MSEVLRQVWCVAYDDPIPHMDGVRRQRTGEWTDRDRAVLALAVVEARSRAATPKRNIGIETRFVTAWTKEQP